MLKLNTAFLFLLITGSTAIAQPGNPVRIEGISYPLYWENKPVSYSLDNGLTIISGSKTDMFRDPNVTYNTDNAPKLLFRPEGDFVLNARISHAFANKWDGGAIVLKQDSLNWIKFCFEKDYTGAKRVVSVVTKNVSDDCNSVEIQSNYVYYKVAKAGNVITLYFSRDGSQYYLIRHLQFDNKKPWQVGFLSQSPTGDRCEVHFSEIKFKSYSIKDPYLGE
jgi:hypothetical protein